MTTFDPRQAVELIAGSCERPRWVLTCEHASNQLPSPWSWSDDDVWLRDQHWAYDIGAAALTRSLAAETGAPAVLARFSRLLIDPNRPPDSATLCRTTADGKPVQLNAQVDDLPARMRYWSAYHDAVASQVEASSAPVVFAIHSFTPVYEGQRRQLEVGVLFDREEDLAGSLVALLRADGLQVKRNEPYSGKAVMIYAAERHASACGKGALEIEVRQDLCGDAAFRARLLRLLADVW